MSVCFCVQCILIHTDFHGELVIICFVFSGDVWKEESVKLLGQKQSKAVLPTLENNFSLPSHSFPSTVFFPPVLFLFVDSIIATNLNCFIRLSIIYGFPLKIPYSVFPLAKQHYFFPSLSFSVIFHNSFIPYFPSPFHVQAIYCRMLNNYRETVIVNKILSSQAPSNCAFTDMYKKLNEKKKICIKKNHSSGKKSN